MRRIGRITRTAGRATWCRAALVVTALVLWVTPADAQRPISIRGMRDLRFQMVLRGVPASVAPLTKEAGRWRVRGERGSEVQVFLILPSALVNENGQTMPVEFSATDGVFGSHPQARDAQTFDPRLPLTYVFEQQSPHLFIFLGGTAFPGPAQAAGRYVAPLSITVSYTGN